MDIYFRSCTTSYNQWGNSRPLVSSKAELTLVCLYSLLRSMRREVDQLIIVDDNSLPEHKILMKKICNYFDVRYEIVESNGNSVWSTGTTTHKLMFESNSDIVYTVEDDYLHKSKAISAIEDFILNYNEYICYPVENSDLYPTNYIQSPFKCDVYSSNILLTKYCHWRQVKTSTSVYAMTKNVFLKNYDDYLESLINQQNCIDHTQNKIYKITPCFSPMPSLTGHISEMCLSLYGKWDKKYNYRLKELKKIIKIS